MNVSKRFLTLLLSVIVLALLASVSLAGPGSFGRSGGEREDVVVTDDGEGCDDETTDEGEEAAIEREAACISAAGIEPSEEGEDEGGEATKAHGLDNAIEHVLANCVKNPQAPGLINALERLAANRERHEAHDAWKAEKEAAKDARKAEKEAAKDARKDHTHAGSPGHGNGHGGAGGNGNPHDGGSHGDGHH